MNEHYWRTTFGALEYDPEVTHAIQDQISQDASSSGGSPKNSQISDDRIRSNLRISSSTGFRNYLEHKVKYREAV